MVCAVTRASDSGNSDVLSIKKEILVSSPLRLPRPVEQYNGSELVWDSSNDMKIGFLA